nr:MAG TPA: hypothetical protein [Caudoviricetes sp.]
MTNERAMEILIDELPYTSGVIEEAIKTVKSALEKQIPKKPDYEGDGYDENGELIYDTWICPHCNHEYEVEYEDYAFCPNCGQALDWSK